jgi:hypothetical protein
VSAAASRDRYTIRRRRRLRTCCRTRTAPRSGHLSKGVRRPSLRRRHASCGARDRPLTLCSRRRPAGRERRPFAPVRRDGFRRATEPLVEHFFHRMAFWPQVVGFAALAMVVGAARGCAPSPDAPGTERGHHVDDVTGNRLVVVREEHPEAGTRLLWRDGLPPVFAGAPAVEHRVVAPVADGHAVYRRPVCWGVVCLAFEHPKNGVSEVLVGWLSAVRATYSALSKTRTYASSTARMSPLRISTPTRASPLKPSKNRVVAPW